MNRALLFGTVVAICAQAGGAAAWDPICVATRPPGDAITAYSTTICTQVSELRECPDGVAIPRGHQLGEHALIAHLAMVWAGLESYTGVPATGHYYNDDLPVTEGITKLTPAGTGGMVRRVPFARAVPEYAEAPDKSYGLSDFIMGNEHCLPNYLSSTSFEDIQSCHSYAGHVAAVNSAHFAPQNKAVFDHYHDIALALAARCKAMATAKGQVDHLLVPELEAQIASCEREALTIEATAAHFLADVWSSGHMWQRPGSPNFSTGFETDGGVITLEGIKKAQIAQLAAGAVSGLIHGWRSLARPLARDVDIEHDQLCLAGPHKIEEPEDQFRLEREAVQWAYPPASGINAPPEFGAGDLYLLTCNARGGRSRWALAPENLGTDGRELELPPDQMRRDRPLSLTYRRMLSCIAASFEEVYNAGPKLAGELTRAVPATSFEADITSPRDARCSGMRATNRSMYLAAGIADQIEFADPAVLARVRARLRIPEADKVDDVLFALGGGSARIDLDVLLRVAARLFLVEMGEKFIERAMANPKGTDAADLTLITREVFFQKPNSFYVDLITGQKVNYLERKNPALWSTVPDNVQSCEMSTGGAAPCDRPREGETARYCDPTAIDVNGMAGPRCVPHEAAILRAFRAAETPYFCRADDKVAIDRQRARCRDSQIPTSEACDACVEVVLPHLRNACNRASYPAGGMMNGNDLRSLCDIYREKGLVNANVNLETSSLYAKYTTPQQAKAVARTLCFEDPSSRPKDQCEDKTCGPDVPNCGVICGDGSDPNFTCCRQPYCAEFENCPGECVDLRTDAENCGCCGTVCPYNSACCGGKCALPRMESPDFPGLVREQTCCTGPNGPEVCSTHYKGYSASPGIDDQTIIRRREDYCRDGTGQLVLTDVANDNQNCGACGSVCTAGQTCCGARCVDTQENSLNCGSCYNACLGGMEACCNGQCAGETRCGCGCNAGFHCVPGFGCVRDGDPDPPLPPPCMAPATLTCNLGYTCTDPSFSPDCGSCRNTCDRFNLCCNEACISVNNNDAATCGCIGCGPNEFCEWNYCYPIGNTPAFTRCGSAYNYCQVYETCCGGGCANTFSDERHCGACDQACDPGQTCCGGCVDVMTDEQNCGECLKTCPQGHRCCQGVCYDPNNIPSGC